MDRGVLWQGGGLCGFDPIPGATVFEGNKLWLRSYKVKSLST